MHSWLSNYYITHQLWHIVLSRDLIEVPVSGLLYVAERNCCSLIRLRNRIEQD